MFLKSYKPVVLVLLLAVCAQAQSDPLPSWNDGPNKQAIIAFVKAVTSEGSPQFVPVPQRIATFDNDGTLWSEQPIYFQFAFALDRVKALAPQHPEWKTQQPFKAVLDGDMKALAASGEKGLAQLIMATHTGMTTDEFAGAVSDWLATAKHPTQKRAYTQLVYQPMLELLVYLRQNGFKTFIVSGGTVEFMRAAGEGAKFMGLVHHTDAEREWAYDRQSQIGKLDKALDEAAAKKWVVVDMKRDWKRIYP